MTNETIDEIVAALEAHESSAPVRPKLPRIKTNDTTIEKLGELLRDNPNGMLVLRDEVVGLIASWEREGREGDRTFFLEAWNGVGSYNADRIGRGEIFIPNLCCSIFGGIQPDKLIAYLEEAANALGNDGLLQRFQVLVYPDQPVWQWQNRAPDKEARDRAFAVYEKLAAFNPVEWGANPASEYDKLPFFRFDPEAQELFIKFTTELNTVKLPAEAHPIIAQHMSKYDKLFPALALIFHLVDCADTGQRGFVSAGAAQRAADFCKYLESHARRVYGLLMDDGLRSALALADKVRSGSLADGFTVAEVRRNQWRYLTTKEAVLAAVEWLEDENWVRSMEIGGAGPRGGRATRRYLINPKVLGPLDQ